MTRSKPTVLPLGTISEGTLRPEDLIPAYLDALEELRLTKNERNEVRAIRARSEQERILEHENPVGASEQMDEASYDLDVLTGYLDAHCPDYTYFGTLEGDGACFGVWPSMDQFDTDCADDIIYKVDDANRLTAKPSISLSYTYTAVVNDHGNVTLYRRSGNRWIEVWSVV